MWVCSTLGFYSAVAATVKPGTVVVRSRVMGDARSLARLVKDELGERVRVERTPQCDYLYRIVMPAAVWAQALALLARGIDYHNFKSRVAVAGDRARNTAYHA
jgi:hypothetical protein